MSKVEITERQFTIRAPEVRIAEGALVLRPPALWADTLRRRGPLSRGVSTSPSLGWRFNLQTAIPRAELYTTLLSLFGPPNDLFDDYKQNFSWWLDLHVDVGRLLGAAGAPHLELVVRLSDYKGGSEIRLWWPHPGPSAAEEAALTEAVYDKVLHWLSFFVGFRCGYLMATQAVPEWSLECRYSRGRFGARDGQFFDEEGPEDDLGDEEFEDDVEEDWGEE